MSKNQQSSAMFDVLKFRLPMPYIVLLVLVLLVASQRSSYLSIDQLNLTTLGTMSLILATMGQTIVLLTGGVDLSVGGIISITTVLAATGLAQDGVLGLFGALLLLILGLLIGALNGLIISRLRMQPFIVTLATWSILSGIALLILPTPGGVISQTWIDIGNLTVGRVSIWVGFLAILLFFWFGFTRWPLGRAIKALGSSPQAAYLAGVQIEPTLIGTYALSGFFSAASGLFVVTQTTSGSPIFGDDFVLPSIAATVIGGTRLSGGSANFAGAVAGAYVLVVINDVVFAFGVAQAWSIILAGALLLSAVLLSEGHRYLQHWRSRAN
jgi:ribose transport system permease protein